MSGRLKQGKQLSGQQQRQKLCLYINNQAMPGAKHPPGPGFLTCPAGKQIYTLMQRHREWERVSVGGWLWMPCSNQDEVDVCKHKKTCFPVQGQPRLRNMCLWQRRWHLKTTIIRSTFVFRLSSILVRNVCVSWWFLFLSLCVLCTLFTKMVQQFSHLRNSCRFSKWNTAAIELRYLLWNNSELSLLLNSSFPVLRRLFL